MLRHLWLCSALLSVGCGGTRSTQPPPPPPPGLARVELAATSGTVFQGHAIPGQLFVARVVDSADQVVPDVVLSAVASPGWAVRGDTVVAPAAEGLGTLRIVATRRTPAGSAMAVAPDSAVSPDVAVSATVNLDTLHLGGNTITCRVRAGVAMTNDSVGPVDSIAYTWAVDSVVYSGTDPRGTYLIGVYGWAGQLWLSGPYTIFGVYGQAHYRDPGSYVALTKQVPDTLTIGGTLYPNNKAPRSGGAKVSYKTAGAPFCLASLDPYTWVSADSLTLTAK